MKKGDAGGGAGPVLDLRVRWRIGWIAAGWAALAALVAVARPLEQTSSPRLRLAAALLLSLGVTCAALMASLKGRGRGERLAFYVFLALSLDGIGQLVAPWGFPVWPLMMLLVGTLAVAERLGVALLIAGLASILAAAEAMVGKSRFNGDWSVAAATAIAGFLLAIAVNRALLAEKRRLSATLAELTRLRSGIDQIEELDGGSSWPPYNTASLTLRQVSEEQRRARQVERAAELYDALAKLMSVARRAVGAHAALYFELDRERERAYLRAADGPENLIADCSMSLRDDPVAFVINREQAFYATDFKRLLWSLPYYRTETKIGTLLAQPVRVGGVLAAVVIVDHIEIQAFSSSEPDLVSSCAEIAADTVAGVKAALSREELGAEFKAAYGVSRQLAALTEPAPVSRLLLRSARDLVPIEAGAVVMLDEKQTRYVVEEAFGWAREYVSREVGISEKTWAAWVLRSADDPYLLDEVAGHKDRMPVLVLDEGMSRAESLLALPLKTRNRALGALMLTGRRGTFDAATNRVLGILSNQAAAALSTLQLLERIKSQAVRDGLTGLYNRRAFDDLLMRSMAREERQEGRLALLLLDLDRFKKLNDTYGHPAGDAALRITAQILERLLRKADQAARFGGEEFVAILPGTDEAGARRLAERMREAIEKHTFIFEGARISLSASFGVAVAPADGGEPEALLAAADRALYAAKQAGRNRVMTASSLNDSKTTDSRNETVPGES